MSSFSCPKLTTAELDFDPKLFSMMFSTYIYFLKGDYISFTARLLFFYHSGNLLEHSNTLSIRWVQHHIPNIRYLYILQPTFVCISFPFDYAFCSQVDRIDLLLSRCPLSTSFWDTSTALAFSPVLNWSKNTGNLKFVLGLSRSPFLLGY